MKQLSTFSNFLYSFFMSARMLLSHPMMHSTKNLWIYDENDDDGFSALQIFALCSRACKQMLISWLIERTRIFSIPLWQPKAVRLKCRYIGSARCSRLGSCVRKLPSSRLGLKIYGLRVTLTKVHVRCAVRKKQQIYFYWEFELLRFNMFM